MALWRHAIRVYNAIFVTASKTKTRRDYIYLLTVVWRHDDLRLNLGGIHNLLLSYDWMF